MMIVAYVSSHGFGHATRTGEVLRCVRRLDPHVELAVVTAGPEWLYRQAIPGSFSFRSLETDVGVAQRDALTIDEGGTVERWRGFAARLPGLVSGEARWLRQVGARVVLADIPPMAFVAAAEADVPSVGLANFSWDWIYRHLARRHPSMAEAADDAAQAYRLADLLLELPFAGDLQSFVHRERIPLVARRPRVSRVEAKARLGFPEGRPTVLLSFGGTGLRDFDPAVLHPLRQFFFAWGEMNWEHLVSKGLGYQDVVAAAEVVVTKPGYGIVSDAIGAGTRLVYTERGDFPEYPVLVAEMAAYLPVAYVSNEDLWAGRLEAALGEVLARPFPPPPHLDGATRAAERLLEVAATS